MLKTLVMYENGNGIEETSARRIALILGPAQILNIKDFEDTHRNYELFVLVIRLHKKIQEKEMKSFIHDNISWIKTKKFAVYVAEEKTEACKKFLNEVKEVLKDAYIDLNNNCYVNVKTKNYEVKSDINFALTVKNYRDALVHAMPEDKLKNVIENFLSSHNTCTLSTCEGDFVRGTPIEYNYKDGYIYFITEGGTKFANLLLNNNISISVYEGYSSMGKLSGMQISGKALLLDIGSSEYKNAFEIKKIPYEQIMKLPIRMNVLKVKLDKVEFLYSEFKKMGYDSKQIYTFK